MRAKAAARMLSGIPVEVRIVFITFQAQSFFSFFFKVIVRYSVREFYD